MRIKIKNELKFIRMTKNPEDSYIRSFISALESFLIHEGDEDLNKAVKAYMANCSMLRIGINLLKDSKIKLTDEDYKVLQESSFLYSQLSYLL